MKNLITLLIALLLGACASKPTGSAAHAVRQLYAAPIHSHAECVEKCHEVAAVGTEFSTEAKPEESCFCHYGILPNDD